MLKRKFKCFSLKLNLNINHYPTDKIITFFHTCNESSVISIVGYNELKKKSKLYLTIRAVQIKTDWEEEIPKDMDSVWACYAVALTTLNSSSLRG